MTRRFRIIACGASLALASCVALDSGAPAPGPSAPGTGRTRPTPAPSLPEPAGRLRVVPERLDFEPVEVGQSAVRSLSLVNEGWAALWIREVSVADSRTYAVEKDGCSRRTLRPREDCRLQVRFVPREPGRVSGILRVSSNEPGRPAYDVRVAGIGFAARRPDIRLRPDRLAFGPVAAGAERVLEAEVANTGGAVLRVRASSISGKGFRVISDLCSRSDLPPGSSCRIAVQFAPPAPGEYEGELRVRSDDPDEREASAALAGTGEAPRARCPQQRLEPLPRERGGGEETVRLSGKLPRGECLGYAVRVREEGRLIVCVPPGVDFEAGGFELVKDGVCRPGENAPPLRMYRSDWIDAGTDIEGLTITRGEQAPREFMVLLKFRPRRNAPGDPGEDD